MAVTLVVEDGSQVAGANSYAGLQDWKDYLATRPPLTKYDGLDLDKVKPLLIAATRDLDLEARWAGSQTSTTQALRFPRASVPIRDTGYCYDDDEIPDLLVRAACEQAIFRYESDRLAQLDERHVGGKSSGGRSRSYSPARSASLLGEAVKRMITPLLAPLRPIRV